MGYQGKANVSNYLKMKEYLLKNKRELIILCAALILGTWVRTANLSGARFLFGDEHRTFSAGVSKLNSPLLYGLYWIPLNIWGYKQEVAIRFTTLFGLLHIVMVYLIGKTFFNKRTGIYAAMLLSLLGIHVWFSRTGLPVISETFLFLVAFLFLGINKDEKRLLLHSFLAGIFMGLAFLVYVPVYSMIAAVLVWFPVSLRLQNVSFRNTAKSWLVILFGLILPLAAFEIISRLKVGSYIFYLYLYYKDTKKFSPQLPTEFFTFFKGIAYLGGTWQLVMLIGGYLYGLVSCFKEKDHNLILLVGTAGTGFLVFTITALLGTHSISLRKYIHLIPFFILAAAYCLDRLEISLSPGVITAFLVIFTIFSFRDCSTIVNNTFNLHPITQWLKVKGINQKKLATNLDLSLEKRQAREQKVPGKHTVHNDRSENRFIINWNQLETQYLKGKVRYLLTSGMDYDSTVGYRDPVLKNQTPLKTWKHPYLLLEMPNPRKNMVNNNIRYDRVQNFSLYDLKEVFQN